MLECFTDSKSGPIFLTTKFTTMKNPTTREVITMGEIWVRCFEQGQRSKHSQDSLYKFVKYSGLCIKKLHQNVWQEQDPKTIVLPIRFVRLYEKINGKILLTGIGIY